MSKAIERHIAAIKSGKVDRTTVIGLRKAFNAHKRAWQTRTDPGMTDEEREAIETALVDHLPIVTGDLHESGMKLLRNPRYRHQLAKAADIIADAQGFKLVGFDDNTAHGTYTPVYLVFNSKGESLSFRCVPWQAGGNGPELVYF